MDFKMHNVVWIPKCCNQTADYLTSLKEEKKDVCLDPEVSWRCNKDRFGAAQITPFKKYC